jgi:TolA-binding protein
MSRRCEEFNESVVDLLYGEISGSEADDLREHAAGCPACRETLEGLLLTRRLAAELPPVEAPEAGREQLLEMARRAAAGFAANRASRPEARFSAFADPGPGLLERLRIALLRPAFATAAAACLVLAVALVLYQRGAGPVDEAGIESAAPFLGPTAMEETAPPSRSRAAAPPPVSSGQEVPSKHEAADELRGAERERSTGSLGTGRVGGGARSMDAAAPGLGTAVPASPGKAAAAAAPAPIEVQEAEDRPAADGWPEASSVGDDLDALPRLESKTAPSTTAGQAFAEAPQGGGGLASAGEATYQSALAAWQRGDCASAAPLFERVVADPGVSSGTRASALHHLALCEKRAARCSQAVQRYDALLDGYPGYGRRPDALWETAACHRRLGNLAEARRRLVDLARYPAWRERAFEELQVIDRLGGEGP